MLLLRILMILALAYGLYRVIRHFKTARQGERLKAPPGSSAPLIRCSRCATLIPPESAIVRGDQVFCSETCRNAPAS